jgi:hypothetical protein
MDGHGAPLMPTHKPADLAPPKSKILKPESSQKIGYYIGIGKLNMDIVYQSK